MLDINQQLEYLKESHGIDCDENHKTKLRNMGYYHGYKGYRFIRNPRNKIAFKSLDEVIALNKFDLDLKSLFYPKIMFIENALKSYAIEAVLQDAKSENLDVIFEKSITDYRSHKKGSAVYHNSYSKRLALKVKINNALINSYNHSSNNIVNHFFDSDKNIPIWAIFESLTLGEFGNFYACSNMNVKKYVSNEILHLPSKFDEDGKITEILIYSIKDLRNAIAHNSVVFDTRFKTGKISKRLVQILEDEIGIKNLDFQYISAYVILVLYFIGKMGVPKEECSAFLNQFISYTDELRNNLPSNVCNQILGTQQRSHLKRLEEYINSL